MVIIGDVATIIRLHKIPRQRVQRNRLGSADIGRMDTFTELFMNREVANMAAKKKIAQTVITEGKYYTINAANGKVVEVADYNIDNGA